MAERSTEEAKPLLHRSRATSANGTADKSHTYGLSKWKRHGACGAILLAVMFERLTFYGISSNLVLFLNEEPFEWLSYNSANASLIFVGLAYVFSVLGGLLADICLGRFKTIVVSFVIYILGSALLVLIGYSSINKPFQNKFCGNHSMILENDLITPTSINSSMYCGWAVYISLVVIAMGTGSVKSNLSPFGGDQVRYEGPEVMRTFFNWFYWAINVGSLIALAGVTALQMNVNFFYGFLVPAASLVIAAGIFVVGRTWYLSRKPMGSVITNTFKIIAEAVKKRKARKVMLQRQDSNELFASRPSPSFLDMAKVRYGGTFHDSMVDDVKSLKKIILVFLGLIPYWVVYVQMQTTFLLQGLHMRFVVNLTCHITINDDHCDISDKDNFQIPPAWLSLFDVIAVLFLLPLFDRVVYPRLDRRGVNFTLLRRMIVGMFFSTLAVIAAGVLEHIRLTWILNHPYGMINETIGSGNTETVYHAADIWVFWQIPQYTLIGIGEVLTSVAGLEFAYSMAPRSMQGLIMGVFHLSIGIAAFIGTAILKVVSVPGIKWFKNADAGNINSGRMDLYFYMLAGVQFLAMIIFAAVALTHEKNQARQRAGTTAINKDHRDDRAVSRT